MQINITRLKECIDQKMAQESQRIEESVMDDKRAIRMLTRLETEQLEIERAIDTLTNYAVDLSAYLGKSSPGELGIITGD